MHFVGKMLTRTFLVAVCLALVALCAGADVSTLSRDGYYKGGYCGWGGPINCVWDNAKSTTFYIGVDGDDENVGTYNSPLRTLQAAVDNVVKAGLGNGNIVYLAGTYTGNQIADFCNTSYVRTICIVSEQNSLDTPSVTFDGDNCPFPIMDLRNLAASRVKVGEGRRRFAFERGNVGLRVSGYSHKYQISNNTFNSQRESAILLESSCGPSESPTVDHNVIANSCQNTDNSVCLGKPFYDFDLCAAVDAKTTPGLDFEYNLVYGSFGSGLHTAAGANIYKNILHDINAGGYLVVEGSDTIINNNWLYDSGELDALQALDIARGVSCSNVPRQFVYAIGLAVQDPGDNLRDITIGNNIINGISYTIAHFHASVSYTPYSDEVCPDNLEFNFGFNTVLNLGGRAGDDDGTPVSGFAGTLLWPNNNEIYAKFHSNIFHYFGDSGPEQFLDNVTDNVFFLCNDWMFEDVLAAMPTPDDSLANIDINVTCSSDERTMVSGTSREDFFHLEFLPFFFYPEVDSVEREGDPTKITSWPINFQPSDTSDAVVLRGCLPVEDAFCFTSRDYDFSFDNCLLDSDSDDCETFREVYRYDFSGHERLTTSPLTFTKGFSEFCNETFCEDCRFFIFWDTDYHNWETPQNERFPAPDPLLISAPLSLSSTVSEACAVPPPPPIMPSRLPSNRAANLFVHPTGKNLPGYGANPAQALRNLQGALDEIVRLTIGTNACTPGKDNVNIIFLEADYYQQQTGDFSVLRVQGLKYSCSKINLVAEPGVNIYGNGHFGALFDLQNLGGVNVWIGNCQGCGKRESWGFTFADTPSHAIWAHSTHKERSGGLRVIGNVFNNIGESAVYVDGPYHSDITNNIIQHICYNYAEVLFNDVTSPNIDPGASGRCWAIDGNIHQVAYNSFLTVKLLKISSEM